MINHEANSEPIQPIKINKQTQDSMIDAASNAADFATQKKIEKRWKPILSDDELVGSLPISRQSDASNKYSLFPDQFVSIPLIGEGEIRLSRESVVWKGPESETSTLVLGIQTTDAKGEKVNIPEFRLSEYQGVGIGLGFKVENFLSPYSYNDPRDLLGGTREKLIKEANRFLASFNPQKDIDVNILPQPTPVQASCLKAFGIAGK